MTLETQCAITDYFPITVLFTRSPSFTMQLLAHVEIYFSFFRSAKRTGTAITSPKCHVLGVAHLLPEHIQLFSYSVYVLMFNDPWKRHQERSSECLTFSVFVLLFILNILHKGGAEWQKCPPWPKKPPHFASLLNFDYDSQRFLRQVSVSALERRKRTKGRALWVPALIQKLLIVSFFISEDCLRHKLAVLIILMEK